MLRAVEYSNLNFHLLRNKCFNNLFGQTEFSSFAFFASFRNGELKDVGLLLWQIAKIVHVKRKLSNKIVVCPFWIHSLTRAIQNNNDFPRVLYSRVLGTSMGFFEGPTFRVEDSFNFFVHPFSKLCISDAHLRVRDNHGIKQVFWIDFQPL